MGVGNVSIQGCDVGGDKKTGVGERRKLVHKFKEVVSVFDIGWERLYKGLQEMIHKGGNPLSGRVIAGHDGASRVVGFVNFGEQVEVRGAGLAGNEEFQGGVRESLARSVGGEEVRDSGSVNRGEIMRKGFVSTVVRELSVGFTMVFHLVHDHSGGTLVSREYHDVTVITEGQESRLFGAGKVMVLV